MKSILAAAALTAITVTGATAQGFEGAQIGAEYTRYDDSADFWISSSDFSADASYTFGNGFGVQVGLGYSRELDSSDPFLEFRDTEAAELHLFYDLDATTRIGALIAYDGYNDGDYLYALEASYVENGLRLETRIGRFDSDEEPAMLYEVHAGYDITPRITLRGIGRQVDYDDGFGHYSLASVGIGYDVTDSIRIYGDYGWHENDFGFGDVYYGNLVTLGVSFALGGPRNEKMFTYSPFY